MDTRDTFVSRTKEFHADYSFHHCWGFWATAYANTKPYQPFFLSLCFETFFFLFGLVWFFNILYEKSRWQLLFCDRRLEAQIDMQHILILKRREKKCTTIKRSGSNNNEAFVKCVRFLHVNGLEMDWNAICWYLDFFLSPAHTFLVRG